MFRIARWRSKIPWTLTSFPPSARTGSRRTTPICGAANASNVAGSHAAFKCDKFPRIGEIHEKLRRWLGLTGFPRCLIVDGAGKAELRVQPEQSRRANPAAAGSGDRRPQKDLARRGLSWEISQA